MSYDDWKLRSDWDEHPDHPDADLPEDEYCDACGGTDDHWDEDCRDCQSWRWVQLTKAAVERQHRRWMWQSLAYCPHQRASDDDLPF